MVQKNMIATVIAVVLFLASFSGLSVQTVSAADSIVTFTQFDETINGGEPIRGVDLSSILAVEAAGVVFYNEDGVAQDIFKTLAENKVNYIRVRVWNNPYDSSGNSYGGGNCDVATAAEIGRRAAQYHMKLLVDLQYSDFWADPQKQTVPKAWSSYTYAQKKQAIYDYTLESLNTIQAAGAEIGMVQIGNETNQFFCGETDMYTISDLFSSGCAAVRAFDPSVLIALHFANPSTGYYDWYAQVLNECAVDYDVFATSYYPYWHGTTANLTSVLKTIGDTYNKYVMVAETAYPYTDEDGDGYGNEVLSTSSGVDFQYDISVAGQTQCLTDVFQAVANVGKKGIGVFYWEPAWLGVADLSWSEQSALWAEYGSGWATAYAGEYDSSATVTGGSSYDNQALFDFNGVPLDSLKVFSNVYPQVETVTTPDPEPEVYDVADLADGTYLIQSLNSNLFLAENNGNVVQSAQQTWTLTGLGSGVYTIASSDGRLLTVENNSAEDGANISLQTANGSDSQKFILRVNADGSYTLLTVISGGVRCADIYGISLEDGANICQWEFWGGVGQRFAITPYTEPVQTTTVATTKATTTTTTTKVTTTTTTSATTTKATTAATTTTTKAAVTVAETGTTTTTVTTNSAATATASTATEAASVSGDVNQDGVRAVSDVVVLQKYLLGRDALNQAQWKAADVYGDGQVNGFDLTLLKQMVLAGAV